MIAHFKSQLLLNFDAAIQEAKDHGMVLEKFVLETPHDLKELKYWVKKQRQYFSYDDMEYEGILIEIPDWLRVNEELTS